MFSLLPSIESVVTLTVAIEPDLIITINENTNTAVQTKPNTTLNILLLPTNNAKTVAMIGKTNAKVIKILNVNLPTEVTITPKSRLANSAPNANCKPEYLEQFAKMGAIYMEKTMGVKNPKVGLVNVGTEEEKGSDLAKSAHKLLKESDLNFVGNIEGRDLMMGTVDVAVCDGFTGNVILKTLEGFGLAIFKISPVSELIFSTSLLLPPKKLYSFFLGVNLEVDFLLN